MSETADQFEEHDETEAARSDDDEQDERDDAGLGRDATGAQLDPPAAGQPGGG